MGSPCPYPRPSPAYSGRVPPTLCLPWGEAVPGSCTEDSGETATGMASSTSIPTSSPVQGGLGAGGGGTPGRTRACGTQDKCPQQHLLLPLDTEGLGVGDKMCTCGSAVPLPLQRYLGSTEAGSAARFWPTEDGAALAACGPIRRVQGWTPGLASPPPSALLPAPPRATRPQNQGTGTWPRKGAR